MDQFVVPTIGFDLLYVLVIVLLARRNLQCHVSSDRRMDCPPDHGSFAEELEAVDQPKTSSRAAGQPAQGDRGEAGRRVQAPYLKILGTSVFRWSLWFAASLNLKKQ